MLIMFYDIFMVKISVRKGFCLELENYNFCVDCSDILSELGSKSEDSF